MLTELLLATQLTAGGVVQHVRFHGVDLDVAASSVLVEKNGDPFRYGPANVMDDNRETVWAEGVTGDGLGEWIELRFPKPTMLLGFELLPGHGGRSERYEHYYLWAANNVATEFDVLVDGRLFQGHRQVLDYDRIAHYDEKHHQASDITFFFSFGKPRPVTSLRLVIRGVRKGEKFPDTCISTFRPIVVNGSGAPVGDSLVAAAFRFAHTPPDALEGFLGPEHIRFDWDFPTQDFYRNDPQRRQLDTKATAALRGAARFVRAALDSPPDGAVFFVDWSDTEFNVLIDERQSVGLYWQRDSQRQRKLEWVRRGPTIDNTIINGAWVDWN